MGQTNRSGVDPYEKSPAKQPTGQITPNVGEDIVEKFMRETKPDAQREVERLAGNLFQPDLEIPSIAKESTRTKYGPGQLTKTPESLYLGKSSF